MTPKVNLTLGDIEFSNFDSMDSVTIHWKAVEKFFIVVLFVFQCDPAWSI